MLYLPLLHFYMTAVLELPKGKRTAFWDVVPRGLVKVDRTQFLAHNDIDNTATHNWCLTSANKFNIT